MLPSSQDRAAQTRMANNQQRASTAQIASKSVRQSLNTPQTGARINPRPQGNTTTALAPQSQQSQQRGGIKPPFAPPHMGPQPVGELGEFIKSLSQQQQMQAAPSLLEGSGAPEESSVDMEEFLQSPALQEAISRTKLSQYFGRRGKIPPADYGESVLSNMDRY